MRSTSPSPWLKSSSSKTNRCGRTESHTSGHGTSLLGKAAGHGRTRTSSENGVPAVRREHTVTVHIARRPKEKRERSPWKTDPEEKALAWRDLGDANMDPEFLFAEAEDSKCPVNKPARKLSQDEANEYMKWVQLRVPFIDKKDERVYCPYYDMKNHPRWTRHHFYKHQNTLREALTHTVQSRTSSFSLSSSFGQWWSCDTQLGTARTQNGERCKASSRSLMVSQVKASNHHLHLQLNLQLNLWMLQFQQLSKMHHRK